MAKPLTIDKHIDNILDDVESGMSLKKACVKNGYPSKAQFYKFIELEENKHLSDRYEKAKEKRAENFIDEIMDLADDLTVDPQQKRIMVDTRKWIACKVLPKVYGDKLKVDSDIVISFEDRIKQLRAKLDE